MGPADHLVVMSNPARVSCEPAASKVCLSASGIDFAEFNCLLNNLEKFLFSHAEVRPPFGPCPSKTHTSVLSQATP
eukprot:8887861-Pyramimonas_sp.AAC.2